MGMLFRVHVSPLVLPGSSGQTKRPVIRTRLQTLNIPSYEATVYRITLKHSKQTCVFVYPKLQLAMLPASPGLPSSVQRPGRVVIIRLSNFNSGSTIRPKALGQVERQTKSWGVSWKVANWYPLFDPYDMHSQTHQLSECFLSPNV